MPSRRRRLAGRVGRGQRRKSREAVPANLTEAEEDLLRHMEDGWLLETGLVLH
jgi:hypothetical protein